MHALGVQGIEARRQQDFADLGPSCEESIHEALRSTDGVVAVFSEPRNPWVEKNLERARGMGKHTFPVILGDMEVPSTVTETRFELKRGASVQGLANIIAARLKDELIDEE